MRLKVDQVVRRLRALATGVDGSNRVGRLSSRRNLGGWCIGLNGLQAVDTSVASLGLADINSERKGDNLGDMGIGTEDADRDTQALAEQAHGLETFLVVGATTTDKDLDLVRDQLIFELLKGADDALEGGSNVGEVGDTSSNDEDLALGVRCTTGNEINLSEQVYSVPTSS